MAEANSTTATPAKAAPAKTDEQKSADANKDATMSKADRDKLADGDPRKYDLSDGKPVLVASGDDKADKKVDDKDAAKAAQERVVAGVPEPPKPGPGSDMYLTAGGYTTVPAGTNLDDAPKPAGPHHPE